MNSSYDDLFIDVEIFNLNQNKKMTGIYPWCLFLGLSIFWSYVLVHRHRFDLHCVVFFCISLLKQNHPLSIYACLSIKLDTLTNVNMKNIVYI